MFDGELEPRTYEPPHTELTLSNGTLLLMFFGLVLVCGLFFGFGYTLGRRSAATALAPVGSGTQDTASEPAADVPAAEPLETPAKPQAGRGTSASVSSPAVREAREVTPPPPTPSPAKVKPSAPASVASAPAVGTDVTSRQYYVQAAAVVHENDAQALTAALRKKGYAVETRQGAVDKLFHVQMGPYANLKEASAGRDKLINDGYMAIIK